MLNLYKKFKLLKRYKKVFITFTFLLLCLFSIKKSYKWFLSRILYLPKKIEIIKLAKFQNMLQTEKIHWQSDSQNIR